MAQGKPITAKERDIISALYFDAKMGANDICEKIGCSNQVIYTQTKLEQMIKNNEFDAAQEYVQKQQLGPSVLEWALKKYNKAIPSKSTEDEKTCPIDKDQFARVMYGVGKIEEQLNIINDRLYNLENAFDAFRNEDATMRSEHNKVTNANADNLYKLITDFRNSVILEIRKRK